MVQPLKPRVTNEERKCRKNNYSGPTMEEYRLRIQQYQSAIKHFYDSYCNLIAANPALVGDLEATFKWSAYVVTGKFSSSSILSECIHSLSNLISLFNDHAYMKATSQQSMWDDVYKTKLILTIIEYMETTLEVATEKKWGSNAKWITVFAIQLIKAAGRLSLLQKQKMGLLPYPPLVPLLRGNEQNKDKETVPVEKFTYSLQSGIRIRAVNGGYPVNDEGCLPTHVTSSRGKFDSIQNLAEVIYILKPIIHLISLSKCGFKSWKPWMASLLCDLMSLHIHFKHRPREVRNIEQDWQLLCRRANLVLYLLRSPFFDRHTKDYLHTLFFLIHKFIPPMRWLTLSLNNSTLKWQRTYFYMWSH